MNKLILENTLKDLDMAKTKIVKKIITDFTIHIQIIKQHKVIFDPDGSMLEKLEKYFIFEEIGNELIYTIEEKNIKIMVDELLILLPIELEETRKKFGKYKNKLGYYSNQEIKIKHKIWKIDAQPNIDDIFYKDISNLIMNYL